MKYRFRHEKKINIPNGLPGVVAEGDSIVLEGYQKEEVNGIANKILGSHEKQGKNELDKTYSPTDEDKAKVKAMVGEDVDEFGIYQCVASDTRIDSERDKFGEAVLRKMEEDYREGRTVVISSHGRNMGVGSTFDAEIITASDGEKELLVKFYISPAAVAPTGNALQLMKHKVYKCVSIYAYVYPTDYVPHDKSEDGSAYYRYDSSEDQKTIHLAIVDMGANPSAKIKSKSSPAATPSFELEEINDSKIIMKYKILGIEFEAEETSKEAISQVEEKVQSKLDKLKAYEDAEEAATKTKQDKLAANFKLLNSEMKAEEAEARAKLFTGEFLDKELENTAKALKKGHKQTDITQKGGKEKPTITLSSTEKAISGL